jgi:hypothetical protein
MIAGGECTGCQKKRSPLQRRAISQAEPAEVPPIVYEVLNSPGQPLDSASRIFMESRFQRDFSHVRVHTNTKAAESAQAVNALAYTVGRNVVFGSGYYAPHTTEGQMLLGHELTHVIQQQGHTQLPLTIGNESDRYEAEADRNANLTLSKSSISTLNTAILQRQSVTLRSGRAVGIDPASNVREEVLQTMDRLHLLWSISNADYNIEYPLVFALPAGSRVSATLIPRTIAAIRRNEEAVIHRDVVRHFLGLNFSDNVGRGQQNNKVDILSLQTRLRALGFLAAADFTSENSAVSALSTGRVAESNISRTLAALSSMKIAIAAGKTGWAAIHADEQEAGGDRFGGRTFEIGQFSVFIPRGVPQGINKVHIFFSPGDVQGESGLNAVLTHGLRGASDSSEWILIGVPGAEPGFVTISTTEIQTCLATVGRSTSINSLRLSAHSRGYRGLRETIRTHLINSSLVERVVILDANYASIATVLQSSGIPASRVIAYDVGTGRLPMPGSRTISLSPPCMRAIGYSRLIQDAMMTRPSLVIPSVIRSQLLTLPARGCFTTSTTLTGCQVNINDFCQRNRTQVNAIIRQENHPTNGLKQFLDQNDLVRFGQVFSAGIYSHHFFVSEIAHEITD